jgi:hypothetical protein
MQRQGTLAPVIVLAAQLHVSVVGDRRGAASRSKVFAFTAQKNSEEYETSLRGDNCDLGAGDAEDQKDKQEKAEHVVELVLPDAADNEEKLNENGTKRQNT